MAVTIKLLGQASVAQAGTDIYTVQPGKEAVVKGVLMVNARWSGTVNANIYLVKGANVRQLSPLNTIIKIGGSITYDQAITMEAGDKIRVNASEHQMVDAIVCGMERDA